MQRNQSAPQGFGMGQHFTSPARPRDKRKTTVRVEVLGNDAKRSKILAAMDALKAATISTEGESRSDGEYVDDNMDVDQDPDPGAPAPGPDTSGKSAKLEDVDQARRIVPDAADVRLYKNWKNLLPRLLPPLLRFLSKSVGVPSASIPDAIQSSCCNAACPRKNTTVIVCLLFDCEFLLLRCIERLVLIVLCQISSPSLLRPAIVKVLRKF